MLEAHLRGAFRGAVIDNRDYKWTDSILLNGVRLAKELVDAAAEDPDHRKIVLVGHSMGGLVLRAANCALQDPNFWQQVRSHGLALGAWDRAEIEEKTKSLHGKVNVCALVTMATPNSGAITFAQMHMVGLLLGSVLPFGLKSAGVQDLRTDHIFRVMQHCQVSTDCLTISGSQGNRFGSGVTRAAHRLVSKLATNLREPNDEIVEDASVDLSQSILPHESGLRHRHVRRYVDCTDVRHTTIHGNLQVLNEVTAFINACNCDGS
jgi:Putative serine esterase (DUF676)